MSKSICLPGLAASRRAARRSGHRQWRCLAALAICSAVLSAGSGGAASAALTDEARQTDEAVGEQGADPYAFYVFNRQDPVDQPPSSPLPDSRFDEPAAAPGDR